MSFLPQYEPGFLYKMFSFFTPESELFLNFRLFETIHLSFLSPKNQTGIFAKVVLYKWSV